MLYVQNKDQFRIWIYHKTTTYAKVKYTHCGSDVLDSVYEDLSSKYTVTLLDLSHILYTWFTHLRAHLKITYTHFQYVLYTLLHLLSGYIYQRRQTQHHFNKALIHCTQLINWKTTRIFTSDSIPFKPTMLGPPLF